MRGLELRKGSIDLVVNDLPPDIVHQFEGKDFRIAKSPGLDYSYLGINMRDPVLTDKRVRQAIGYAIDRDAIVEYLRRGLARPATGLIPSQAWAYEPDIFQFTYDPNRARQLLDEAGYKDPDGDGPLPRLQLSLKVSQRGGSRVCRRPSSSSSCATSASISTSARTSSRRCTRTCSRGTSSCSACSGSAARWSIPTSCAASSTRRRRRPPASIAGTTATPKSIACSTCAGAATTEAERKKYYGEAQKIIAEDAPYISIWNRTNVAVAQPTLTGLHLNAVGDFESLKDVIKTVGRERRLASSATRALCAPRRRTASRDGCRRCR